jgi:hypothetical protein
MKIINEKGKLFGIINIVDLLILVVVILVAGAIVWQLLGSKVSDAISPQEELTAVVVIAGAHPDLVEEVMRQDLVGDKMVSGNEYLGAYISDVWLDDYVEQIETADGRLVDAVDPTKKDIFMEIKTTVAADTASPKIGSQEIRAGKTFIVKTQTFECSGIIYYVQIGDAE